MPALHEAIEVLDRTLSWLLRDPRHVAEARHLEGTLSRWAAVDEAGVGDDVLAGLGEWRALLGGLDATVGDEREGRVRELSARLAALRAAAGPTPERTWEVRARLLPDGIAAEIPPKRPKTEAVESAPAAEAPEGEPRPERREERREARRDEGRREERGERREERGERREERGERRDDRDRREGRREGRREDREGRREDREGRREDRRDDRERAEKGEERTEERPPEARPAEVVPPPPPPEPEIRTFPLGHPEETGRPLASLGVFTAEELTALAAAGIEDVADLLTRPPVRTERAGERLIPDVPPEGAVIVRGTVSGRCTRFAGGLRWYEIRLVSDRARVVCRWAGAGPAEVRQLKAGQEAGLAGRLEDIDGVPVLYEAEILGIDGRGGDWHPVYEIPGVPESQLRAAMRAALRRYADTLADHLPPEVLERYKLLPLPAALREVHFPPNQSRKGRTRMAFDEMLQVQLGVALSRARPARERGIAHGIGHRLVAQALASNGWTFTDVQEMAFDEIRRDLRRKEPMARLLQGDAGTGKQLVIQAAMLVACEAQSQVLYIAPDALTAEHRYLFGRGLFESVGLTAGLLNGGPGKPTSESLKKGETHVVYATPAILKSLPPFRRLGLVVVEEQGVFGGVDLGALEIEGSPRPHVLVTTPTPIPSALALTVYGHLALTTMAGSPGKDVHTAAFTAEERESAYAAVREMIEAKQQVLLVFPLKRNNEDLLSPSEARRIGDMLEANYFPGARIGLFSGAMSREERWRAYDDFTHRRTDLLVCTTAVEHGQAVPNAPLVVVESAQSVDLVRLHRLRAHVAGGFRPGRCMLVLGEDPGPDARHDIDLVLHETDGYKIAELDLAHRGMEAVLGEHASDAPGFAWADPVQDRELLLKTRQESVRLLSLDPGLKRRAHRPLLHLVRARFGEEVGAEAPAGAPTPEPGGGGGRKRRRRRR